MKFTPFKKVCNVFVSLQYVKRETSQSRSQIVNCVQYICIYAKIKDCRPVQPMALVHHIFFSPTSTVPATCTCIHISRTNKQIIAAQVAKIQPAYILEHPPLPPPPPTHKQNAMQMLCSWWNIIGLIYMNALICILSHKNMV